MRLTPGVPAPQFIARTIDDREITRDSLKGSVTWLAFFRYASCPLCNLRIHQMHGEWERFAKYKFRMLAIFESKREKLEEYVTKNRPPFDLIADPEKALYKAYNIELKASGMFHPANMVAAAKAMGAGIPILKGAPIVGDVDGPSTRVPADFVMNRDGLIRIARYGKHISDSIPFDEVTSFLDEEKA